MSVTLATVADALIEFILSLLRDPELAAEFDEDPEAAMATRGLNNVSHADVCAVAPVVVERVHVVAAPEQHHYVPKPATHPHDNPVIREIKSITQQWSWVDDRDTVVDQSVNQNIWTEGGDVTQTFDNEAVVASGDEATAVGDDLEVETNIDESTSIEAGEDVHIGDETTTNDIDGSFNDGGSFEQGNTAEVAGEASDTASTDAPAQDAPAETATDEAPSSEPAAAVEYTETNAEGDASGAFESEESTPVDEPATGEDY